MVSTGGDVPGASSTLMNTTSAGLSGCSREAIDPEAGQRIHEDVILGHQLGELIRIVLTNVLKKALSAIRWIHAASSYTLHEPGLSRGNSTLRIPARARTMCADAPHAGALGAPACRLPLAVRRGVALANCQAARQHSRRRPAELAARGLKISSEHVRCEHAETDGRELLAWGHGSCAPTFQSCRTPGG